MNLSAQGQPGTAAGAGEPVTVVITRRVKAGREADYEAWLARLQAAARGVPGYLGVTTQRPAPGATREYVSAVRFASLDDLRRYETSALHRDHLAEVAGLVEGDATWQQLTGLEFWFTPPPGMAVPQPSRPRMVLLMVAVVFTLVLSLGALVNALAALSPWPLPYPLRLLITITLEVLLMTYWLMPQLTRRLARWIYPAAAARA